MVSLPDIEDAGVFVEDIGLSLLEVTGQASSPELAPTKLTGR